MHVRFRASALQLGINFRCLFESVAHVCSLEFVYESDNFVERKWKILPGIHLKFRIRAFTGRL